MPPRVPRASAGRPARRGHAAALLAALLGALAACAAPSAPGRPGAPACGGPLRVASSPVGARVMVDGAATNFRTPTVVGGLAPGPHRIVLTLPGHRNWSGEVLVDPVAGASVSAVLAPLATGSLAVESVPAGAAIAVDGEDTGLATPAVVARVPVGTHTVQLRRDGYEVWSQAVVVMQERRLAIDAVLAPDRSRLGHLAVQSRPPRARISLDGYPTGRLTPDTLRALQPGAHRLELSLEGHRTWRGEVAVREGRTADLLVTLDRAEARQTGSARVESDPPGAAISLGGVPLRRKTPADLEGLGAGCLAIELSRPGSRPWRGELTVVPGERTVLAVRLEPDTRASGSVRVESDPPGARVSIDEAPWGWPTPTLVPNLSPAGHRVELDLPGHRPWAGMVQVTAGGTATLRARLVPRPFAVSARVVAGGDEGGCAVVIEARRPDGRAAVGEIGVEVAAPGGRRIDLARLVDGVARVLVPVPPGAAETAFSVLVGDQRELFVLRRGAGGWEAAGPE